MARRFRGVPRTQLKEIVSEFVQSFLSELCDREDVDIPTMVELAYVPLDIAIEAQLRQRPRTPAPMPEEPVLAG